MGILYKFPMVHQKLYRTIAEHIDIRPFALQDLWVSVFTAELMPTSILCRSVS